MCTSIRHFVTHLLHVTSYLDNPEDMADVAECLSQHCYGRATSHMEGLQVISVWPYRYDCAYRHDCALQVMSVRLSASSFVICVWISTSYRHIGAPVHLFSCKQVGACCMIMIHMPHGRVCNVPLLCLWSICTLLPTLALLCALASSQEARGTKSHQHSHT